MNTFSIFILTSLFILCNIGCTPKQKEDQQIISIITDFYTAHEKLWDSDIDPYKLLDKLDSLQQRYCTTGFYGQLKRETKESGLDHDVFTNDYGADDQFLKTLLIKKEPQSKNLYVLTYSTKTEDPRMKVIKVNVTIYISILKENGQFKINDVSPDKIADL